MRSSCAVNKHQKDLSFMMKILMLGSLIISVWNDREVSSQLGVAQIHFMLGAVLFVVVLNPISDLLHCAVCLDGEIGLRD